MKSSPTPLRPLRGSAAIKVIVALLVLAAAGGAWWYLTQRETAPTISAIPTTSVEGSANTVADPTAAAATAAVEGLSIDQLYREARKAMAEQRMVAPAGNNALEFYLAILAKDESNAGAADALRELFPFASGTAEQEINQGNLVEGERIIASLAKADPSNYTLTILRSKLDAKKKLIEQQETLAAAAAAAPAPKPSVESAAQTPPADTNSATVSAAAAPATADSATTPPAATPKPAPAPVVALPKGETHDVEVVTPVAPSYPSQAARNREEGWVEVEFTVTADGKITGAKVTASDPARVFDREAIRSIERSKFNPRVENGTPVSSTVRRRIEFKLGR